MNKCLNKLRLLYKHVSLKENEILVWEHWKTSLLDTYPVSGIVHISCVIGRHNLNFEFSVSTAIKMVASNPGFHEQSMRKIYFNIQFA